MERELGIYTVRDAKAEMYFPPFNTGNTAMAMRMFRDACLQDGSLMRSHPEDFSLWQIGMFDCEKGTLKVYEPICLGQAVDLIGAEE